MNILQVLARNLRRGPLTLRFPKRVAAPPQLRGSVNLNPSLCVGCGTCAYVCASSAIRVTDLHIGFDWAYDPGHCTFCGRCVDFCPLRALAMEPERPPVYLQRGALARSYRVDYPLCPECGQPTAMTDSVLLRAFGQITDGVRAWSRLCSRCRQQRDALVLAGARLDGDDTPAVREPPDMSIGSDGDGHGKSAPDA